ncbi:MAG: YtxH domain-containing protein, partial [Bacteroidetes bacterium]|nr:YtxH domain-containing protein [Bacteroidota bacterium]
MLAGLAAGVAIGILFAPDKGSETRDKLTDALKNLGDTIKDRVADEIGNLSEVKDTVVEEIKSKMKSAKVEFTEIRGASSSAAVQAEETIKDPIKS